jgi:sulfhydrogenase subunit delta
MSKPTVGIFGLTGCAGDQLAIINCEDELLDLVNLLDIRDFVMAASEGDPACALDIAFVEGAVLSKHDEEYLKKIRARAKTLVAIGTCAVWGGVAAMDGGRGRDEMLNEVYGPAGARYDSTPARALGEVVKVDLKISGCPIEKDQFLGAVANLLNGDAPLLAGYAVCAECKMRENNCLLVENHQVCCGPLTVAGCGARCPGLGIACVGCRGPAADANFPSAMEMFAAKGIGADRITAKLKTFANAAGGGQ